MFRMNAAHFFIAFTAFFLTGCGAGVSETYINDNIDAELKQEISGLNDIMFTAVRENNPALLDPLTSELLKEANGDQLPLILREANMRITSETYQVRDEFYVTNSVIGNTNTVFPGEVTDSEYSITYVAQNSDMYVSVLETPGNGHESLILCVYGKYGDDWKLNILNFGQLRFDGLTAKDFFDQSKALREKGHLIDALNYVTMGSQILYPSAHYWKYSYEDEMKAFYDDLMVEILANYQFPVALAEVESTPQIINIIPRTTDSGILPMVEYITTVNMGDSVALRAENDQVHAVIGATFKGIDKDKSHLFYRAYDQMPDGSSAPQTYGFIQEVHGGLQ